MRLWIHIAGVIGVLSFWVLLGLPGLAWLQRFDSASLERGALSAIGRAYLASFALLTPVSALGYLLHAPLWVLSATCALAIALGVAALIRDRRWLALFARPGLAAAVCGAWLLFDLWLGARVGSHVQGDAGFHVARIRLLVTFGFNNWDPLLGAGSFESIYHTNLYHALIAASAQLARVDAGAAWIWVWPCLKLLAAAASYELAFAVLGSRPAGYLAALATGVCFALAATQVFPNAFAAGALSAFGLAFALEAACSTPRLALAAWVGVASLLLAQTHPLYAMFFGLAVAPLLAARLLYTLLRRRSGRLALLASLCALALALPWLFAQAQERLDALWASAPSLWVSRAYAQAPPPPAAKRAYDRGRESFIDLGDLRFRLNHEPFVRADNPDVQGIAALLLVAALGRGAMRMRALALLAILASVAAFLFVPALCSLLIRLTAHWIVLRFTGIYFVVAMALVPSALFAVASAWLRGRWARAVQLALELAGAVLAVAYARQHGQHAASHDTWQAARAGGARPHAERIASRARFFAQHIEPGAVVMAPLLRDYDIPMHCACRALIFRRGRGERGLPGLDERRGHSDEFYAHATRDEKRKELLQKYAVKYVYASPRRAVALARGLGGKAVYEGEDGIVVLGP